MKTARIKIIGAGQLGSRHLQALAALKFPASIEVVDPSSRSLEVARQRWQEVKGHGSVDFRTVVGDGETETDVVIIATTADVRRRVVENVVAHCRPVYVLLEKVVFQHPDDFTAVARLFKDKGVRAWVNCPRRMWPFYQELRTEVKTPVHIEVTGSNWGLGCNAIHFLDLFAYLSREKEFFLTSRLDTGHTEGKRAGFVEFTGTLLADFGAGGGASITSSIKGDVPVRLTIEDPAHTWEIEEGKGTATVVDKKAGTKIGKKLEIPFQSKLTNIVVSQLLSDGECSLTTFGESWTLHVPLLELISEHLHGPGKVKPCPIT